MPLCCSQCIVRFAFWVCTLFASVHTQADDRVLVRAYNLNGPPLTIDGHAWEGDDSPSLVCDGQRMENGVIPLSPPLRGSWESMIRSSRWGRDLKIEISDLEAGPYQLAIYCWEDNASTTFQIEVNGELQLERVDSGVAGTWKRLGPFPVSAQNGKIQIRALGGDANLSGIELWRPLPKTIDPSGDLENETARQDRIAFFESRVRPTLIEHCYACHSADAEEIGGNLLLDSEPGWRRGGDSGLPIIVPHSPDRSLLMIAVAKGHESWAMPPDTDLPREVILDLERWIADGAEDPRTSDRVARSDTRPETDWAQAKDWWSLRPIHRPSVPSTSHQAWCHEPIDAFVLARMEREGLSPGADADRSAWLRRVSLDLTGLIPSIEEQNRFLEDPSPTAFEDAVDRMLASRAYAERWGRHWLDVVRYSDTAGDNSDFPIPQMVLYRNWVIDAFHEDMPYDRFVQCQLAGDLLPATDALERYRGVIATGYIANARRFGSRVDDYPQHLTIEDTLDNLGRTFLATTLNCARCHNHKFDPITTDDYYAWYGFFSSTRYPWPGIELDQKQRDLVPLTETENAIAIIAQRREEQKRLDDELKKLEARKDKIADGERAEWEQRLAEAKDRSRKLADSRWPFPLAYAILDHKEVGDARIQNRGDPNKLGPRVLRRNLMMIDGAPLSKDDTTSGRATLARWITSPENPLTARVMVNRIWLHHFGRGLVETPNDFGRQGRAPSHPELLDWLAAEFQESGWSIKHLHRCILRSHVYRLATTRSEESIQRDPNNVLLTAYPLRRMDAESLRDSILELSDALDHSVGGEHPFPPPSEWKFTQHNPFKAVYESQRRSVYLMTQRIQRHPYLAIFDGADPAASTAFRSTSTTPLQALFFLNSDVVHQACDAIAQQAMKQASEDKERIRFLYRHCFSRSPQSDELEHVLSGVHSMRVQLEETLHEVSAREMRLWRSVVRSFLRSNEFIYID